MMNNSSYLSKRYVNQSDEGNMTKTKVQVPEGFDRIKFINEAGNKSKAIRQLNSEGKTRSEIATMLDLRYQHVRNVLITPIKQAK